MPDTEEKKLVTMKIDGQEITVPEGMNVIDAAEQIGIYIPRFCYHPALSVAGNCRMCLVETNQARKPVPACREGAREGLEVTTNSDRIKEARKDVLEFILLDHPVDCPICDKAGECMLQEQYSKFSLRPSSLSMPKVHKPKVKVMGPTVLYDAERCINCTRCVRFMAEIAKDPVLTQVHRGDHAYIDLAPDKVLNSPYSMNVVDLCPVGALTSRDFRFKARVWFLESTDTVCSECSRGCNIRVDTYKGEIKRIVPRENPDVNGMFMCDHGRLAYHEYENDRLFTVAGTRTGDMNYTQAVNRISLQLLQMIKSGMPPVVILSPFMTNEDAWVAIFSLKVLANVNVFAIGGNAQGEGDDILIREDKNPNTRGLMTILKHFGIQPVSVKEAIEQADNGMIVFGTRHAWIDEIAKKIGTLDFGVILSAKATPATTKAAFALPVPSPYETTGTWTNEFGITQRVQAVLQPQQEARPIWQIVQDMHRGFARMQTFTRVEEITDILMDKGLIALDDLTNTGDDITVEAGK